MLDRAQIKKDVRAFIKDKWFEAFLASFLVGLILSVGTILSILLLPLTVSLAGYYIKYARGQNPQIGDAFNCFNDRYVTYLGTMLWQALFTFLWTMLFFIPGIIKGIAYMFTPYIISENPGLGAQKALKLSMTLTRGHKWELFVVHLSFFWWFLLGCITCGIAYIYIVPYFTTTFTVYYEKLKEKAIAEGKVNPGEFYAVR